jgi:hypothetical protein
MVGCSGMVVLHGTHVRCGHDWTDRFLWQKCTHHFAAGCWAALQVAWVLATVSIVGALSGVNVISYRPFSGHRVLS